MFVCWHGLMMLSNKWESPLSCVLCWPSNHEMKLVTLTLSAHRTHSSSSDVSPSVFANSETYLIDTEPVRTELWLPSSWKPAPRTLSPVLTFIVPMFSLLMSWLWDDLEILSVIISEILNNGADIRPEVQEQRSSQRWTHVIILSIRPVSMQERKTSCENLGIHQKYFLHKHEEQF